jgi:hypothetical protein
MDKKHLAVEHLKNAQIYWNEYSIKISKTYYPQILTRFVNRINVSDFDRNVEEDIRIASVMRGEYLCVFIRDTQILYLTELYCC